MPMYDFECEKCHEKYEDIVKEGEASSCAKCSHANWKHLMPATKTFTTIIPDYPGAKKHKAGYVHSHGDKPATKIQVGASGKDPS